MHEEAKNVETSFPVIRHSQLLRLIRSANIDLDEDEELQQVCCLYHCDFNNKHNATHLKRNGIMAIWLALILIFRQGDDEFYCTGRGPIFLGEAFS